MTRRRRGFIQQLGPGRWEVRVYAGIDPATGKELRRSRTIRGSQSAAERRLTALLAEVDTGSHQDSLVTVSGLLDVWLAHASDDLKVTTRRNYARDMEKHIIPSLGDMPLAKLTARHLDQLYARLRTTHAPATVHQIHSILRRSLSQAHKWGWITDNPAERATPPKVRQKEIKPPKPAVVAQLIDAAADDPTLATAVWLATVTGARRGELCALRWSGIDLDAGTMLIDRGVVYGADRQLVEQTPKTHQARKIALDAPTVAMLREHRARMLERSMTARLPLAEDPFVFSDTLDLSEPVAPDALSGRFRTLTKHADVKVRFHDLRHFAATQALAAGVPVRTVSGRLGHADAHTTLNVYGHFLETADKEAADILGGILERARATGGR